MESRNTKTKPFEYALLNMAIPHLTKSALTIMDNMFCTYLKPYMPFNDAYELWNGGIDYILGTGYERSKATGVGIIDPIPLGGALRSIPPFSWATAYVPRFYVFSGTEQNLNQIASYGDKINDEKAREFFDRVYDVLDTTTIVNLFGADATKERTKIIKSLAKNRDVFNFSRALGANINKIWNNEKSLQDNITYVGASIIGECFLGISDFPEKYVSDLRNANDLAADVNATKEQLADVKKKMLAMNDDIFNNNPEAIIHANGYVSKQVELLGDESQEELKEKLKNSHGGSGFVVESNLSYIIMVALAQISSSPEMMENLLNEIRDTDINDPQDLKNLFYLDCIYRETLRFASPTALIPRRTSVKSTMQVENRNGKTSSCTIYPNSYLFFGIRCINHDASIYKNPELFDPSRFMASAKNHELHFIGKDFFPFSSGGRGCPAGRGFIEHAFKGFLVEFFKKFQLVLDQPLESISPTASHPRWHNEYYAKLQEHSKVELAEYETLRTGCL